MEWAAARAAFERHLSSNFSGAPVQYPGVAYTPEKDKSWVRMNDLPDETKRVSLGPGGTFREEGLLVFSVFSPNNRGTNAARTLADALGTAFHEANFSYASSGYIRCKTPRLDVRGPTEDGAWFQINVTVEYDRDVQRSA